METGYKPLVETPEGELVSIWAGGGVGRAGYILKYKGGEITYNPEGKAGIWVSETLEQAKDSGFGNKNKDGVLVVYEVTPLGKRMGEREGFPIPSTFGYDVRYPAILLGKEVWSDRPKEEPRPEPKFKVGDRVKIKDNWVGKSNKFGGTHMAWSGVVRCVDEGYVGLKGYRYIKNEVEAIEPAPIEEWVDVTGECTAEIYEGHVLIRHNSTIRIILGQKGLAKSIVIGGRYENYPTGKDYKVEVSDINPGWADVGTFTVFKKK